VGIERSGPSFAEGSVGNNAGMARVAKSWDGACRKQVHIGGTNQMKKLWSLFQHRIAWTSGAALLAIVAVPAISVLVLKALGLVHSASLHTWLFDVGQNMGADGAAGSLGSTGACAAGDPGDDGDSTDNLLDQMRKGIWPYGNPNDAGNGPQLRANPGMIGAPIQSPSDGPPVFPGFSGSVGDKLEQFVDFLGAASTWASGRGDNENKGTAADPVEDVE
jgi:hypothetical protein